MSNAPTQDRPTAAGMYDYFLGGTTHTAADRAAAEQVLQIVPEVSDGAWANRGFLQRAVRRMAGEWRVRQFIDIGAGLPTQRNTHQVAAEVATGCRVVYVDIDPVAVAKGHELLGDTAGTTVIEADVREVRYILEHPRTRALIDFSQPVGLLMVAVLHFVPDIDDPWQLMERYLAAIPSGSYLALSHASGDHTPARIREAVFEIYRRTATPPSDRSKTEIERFFTGLETVPPYQGAPPELTFTGIWGAEDPQAADTDGSRLAYAAVARKP